MAKKDLHKFTVQEAVNRTFEVFTVTPTLDTSECDVTWLSGTIPATFAIPVGTTIYGYFASIELDSGAVIAYYG